MAFAVDPPLVKSASGSADLQAERALGSTSRNLAPRPASDATVAVPPCASTIDATIDNPRPLPPLARDRDGSDAVEPLEHAGQVVGGDARPVVRHVERHAVLVADGRQRRRACPRGVCARALASRFPTAWRSRSSSPSTAVSPWIVSSTGHSGCSIRASSTRSAATAAEVDRLALQRPALVEPGEQQHVVDQDAHPGRVVLDPPHHDVQVLGPLGGAAAEQLGVAAHGGQRRPQLVRRVGDEAPQPVLRPLALGERLLDLGQHLVQRAAQPARPRCAGRCSRRAATGRRRRSRRPSARSGPAAAGRRGRGSAPARPRRPARSRRPAARSCVSR